MRLEGPTAPTTSNDGEVIMDGDSFPVAAGMLGLPGCVRLRFRHHDLTVVPPTA